MSDPAHLETEKIIKQIEQRINQEYTQAVKEVSEKLNDYMCRFYKKDETWRKWVESAKGDPKEYKQRLSDYKKWRTAQIAVGKRWSEMKETLAEDLKNTGEIARSIAQEHMPEVYALNHDYGTYTTEMGAGKDTGYSLMTRDEALEGLLRDGQVKLGLSFTLYDKNTLERLMRDNPELLPPPGWRTQQAIAEGKAVRWNKQQIQSVMMQSLLQGESIPKIATRLAETVGDRDRKAAIRNARTMATGAQNAGRVDSYKRAEDMGIKMQQQWLAVHDGRTRHSHRMVDYEIQPVGHEFSNGCEYPGDPSAPASEIYNCRCTLRGLVDGLEPMARKSIPDLIDIGNGQTETYEEWRNSRNIHSDRITKQDEIARKMRGYYINQYRKKARESQ